MTAETTLHRLTLTFRRDGAVDAVFIRKGSRRHRHEIRACFDDYGWRQWGDYNRILRENVCLLERLETILPDLRS
jgi:hypothetical protein